MPTDTPQLTPIQAAILDVYRRLNAVGLSTTATHDVVATHARVKLAMASRVASELVELGLLTNRTSEGRTKRSMVLAEQGRAYQPPPVQQAS